MWEMKEIEEYMEEKHEKKGCETKTSGKEVWKVIDTDKERKQVKQNITRYNYIERK